MTGTIWTIIAGSSVVGAIFGAILDDPILDRFFPANKPPISVLSPQKIVTTTLETIVLSGSGANDPDGEIVEFNWGVDGKTVPESGNSQCLCTTSPCKKSKSIQCKFVAPGIKTVSLRVLDDRGASTVVSSTVSVNAPAQYMYIVPRHNAPDARIVEAVYNAIDWKKVDSQINEEENILLMVIDPQTGGHLPAVAYAHDPKKSKKLMAEAGYPRGLTLKIALGHKSTKLKSLISVDLNKIGIGVEWLRPNFSQSNTGKTESDMGVFVVRPDKLSNFINHLKKDSPN